MVLIADVTTEETALGMVEYGNDLFIAFHTDPKNGTPGTIVRYNDLSVTYGTAYKVIPGQGLGDIRVINGKVYVTSLDFDGNSAIFVYDGSKWQVIAFNGPSGLLDIDYYNGRFYAAGYSGGTPELYSSPDGATGWAEVYSGPAMNRFSRIAVFNGKMFFTPQTSNQLGPMYFEKDIFSYDGVAFTPIEFSTAPMEVTDLKVFDGALYLTVWSGNTNVPGMYRSADGASFSPVVFFGASPVKAPKLVDLTIYGNKLYVAEFGAPTSVLYESSDGINWRQAGSLPTTLPTVGSYTDTPWHRHVALGVYRGRFYAVPPAQGKLYVSGVKQAGELLSTVKSLAAPIGKTLVLVTFACIFMGISLQQRLRRVL